MHVQLPKPMHGWREFAGEVGIIVLGVLIALAAGQLVESWNWSRKVSEARQRLAPELGEDLGQAELYDRSRSCTEHRLDELAAIIVQAQQTGRLPRLGNPSQPYWFTWDMGVWQSLVADQTATHFGHDELGAYSGTYQFIASIEEASKEQLQAWTTLSGLTGPGRRFEPGEANFYLQAITRARFLSRFIAGAGVRAQQLATAYDLPIDASEFHSYADLPPNRGLCDPVSRTGAATYGQAPWKGSVEDMRAHPITRKDNGMKDLRTKPAG
jgi:hypothetical protein